MNFYEIDTLIRFSVAFTTVPAGAPIDPTSINLLVQPPPTPAAPDMIPPPVEYTYAAAQIVRDGVGLYHCDLTPNEVGIWVYKWQGTGAAAVTTADTRFVIKQTTFFPSQYFPC